MELTLRKLTDQTVAYSVWLLPDNSVITSKITQAEYDDFAITKKWVGEVAGRPSSDARWLMAAGGRPALDTPDGWPSIGDCWEQYDDFAGKVVLKVAQGDKPDFTYEQKIASDPGKGVVSELSGVRVYSSGNEDKIEKYDVLDLSKINVLQKTPVVNKEDVTGEIYNHKSISFDAGTSGTSGNASSVSFSHTTASQSNRYALGGYNWSNNLASISSITYNAVAFAAGEAQIASNVNMAMRSLAAPTTGANTYTATISSTSTFNAASVVTYYGVAQTGSLGTYVKGSSGTGSPTITVTSAATELVVDMTGDIQSFGGTLTVGSGQTERTRSTLTGLVSRIAVSDEAGAASVVMDWTHTSSEWISIGVPLRESVAATTSSGFLGTFI